MTHLYSSCRSACLSATWRFRDALLHSTLPHSWQVNSFFADWVFREFKVSPGIEVSTCEVPAKSGGCNPWPIPGNFTDNGVCSVASAAILKLKLPGVGGKIFVSDKKLEIGRAHV